MADVSWPQQKTDTQKRYLHGKISVTRMGDYLPNGLTKTEANK